MGSSTLIANKEKAIGFFFFKQEKWKDLKEGIAFYLFLIMLELPSFTDLKNIHICL
jgi:hypothetical protein